MEIPEGYKIVKINLDSQKKAQKKYYEKNKAKINLQRLEWYKNKYNTDEEFKKKEQLRNLENSRKKIKKNI
jgi:hypothetical protein